MMAALIALISVQIVLRYFFDSPLQWSLEISRILFLWIVFLGAAIAVQRGQYTSLDVISRALPSWWTERLVVAVMVIFAILLATLGTEYVRTSQEGHFTMTGLPDIVVYVAPAVSGVLMFLFGLERLLNTGKKESGNPTARAAGDT